LRYQNRAIWKVRLTKKTILQRLGDGSEKPLENESKPWPIFDRTYKRQNQLVKKAVERESSDDDDDSVSSNGGDDDCPLAPPAPTTFSFRREEKVYEVELGEEVTTPRASSPKKSVASLLKGDFPGENVEKEVAAHGDERSVDVQESGISTSESPKRSSPAVLTTQRVTGFPSQSLAQPTSTNETNPPRVALKPPQSAPPHPKGKGDVQLEIVPRSIPRTICYSLRSAIGDGSARQRNSHTLMDQRPLRPNGVSVDVSYWSHRGKRSYMEGKYNRFKITSLRSRDTHFCILSSSF